MYDLIIVGAGPAGITAAIYALRAGLDILVLEKEFYGGKMNYTNNISNYPGFIDISGVELSEKMFENAKSLNVKFEYAEIVDSKLDGDVKILISSSGKEYESCAVIIATGLKTRNLQCKGEEKLKGKGVSYCATCDGFFFKDKRVAVVGGGNTAIEDAVYLAGICQKVFMIVRKNFLRGNQILEENLKHNDKIQIIFNSIIKEILGENKVEKILIESNGEFSYLDVNAVFVAIGQEPISGAFSEIDSNKFGYFLSNEECETNLDGVFVAGDCREKSLRQIVTATSDGAISASKVIKFIKKMKKKLMISKV